MSASPAKTLTVAELKSSQRRPGEAFEAILLIRKLTSRTAKNNNPFLIIEAGDKSGSFQFTCFHDNPVFAALKEAGEGAAIRLRGQIDHYQNRFSPRVVDFDLMDEASLSRADVLDRLVPSTEEDPDALMEELFGFVALIGHEGLRGTVEAVFAEIAPAFKTAPAAVSMHHACRGGLLEHTVHMARACRALLPLYAEVHPDLTLAGVLLHDIGKTVEYEGSLAFRRSRTGILQGHVVLGYRMVRKAGLKVKLDADLLERLEHIVLSHQGELEWGAAAMAATPEAVFVSMVDNLDARMGMVQQALRETAETEVFSDYLPGLKAPLLRTPPASGEE